MSVWAIADLHLSFATANKSMALFGSHWENHPEKIRNYWEQLITDEDLVLIAGDISWASKLEQALADLEWIDSLPGTKVMIRGNHDYWWPSLKKLQTHLPKSIHAIHNSSFTWNDVSISGSRLWDTQEYNFSHLRPLSGKPFIPPEVDLEEQEKIFSRELQRLEISLQKMDPNTSLRLVMTHYPPIGTDLKTSRASAILDKYQIDTCVFGHLHKLDPSQKLFGTSKKTSYHLTACDYLDFCPIKIA
jgi:uncharacterized protein